MRISKARLLTTGTAATLLALSLGGAGMVHAQTAASGTNSLAPSSYSSGAANAGVTGSGIGVMNSATGSSTAGTRTTSGTVRTTSTQSAATGTPGIPNTGAAGDAAANMALLGISALAILGAGTYLWRRRSEIS